MGLVIGCWVAGGGWWWLVVAGGGWWWVVVGDGGWWSIPHLSLTITSPPRAIRNVQLRNRTPFRPFLKFRNKNPSRPPRKTVLSLRLPRPIKLNLDGLPHMTWICSKMRTKTHQTLRINQKQQPTTHDHLNFKKHPRIPSEVRIS